MAVKKSETAGHLIESESVILLFFAGVMWVVELANLALFHGRLCAFGVRPRVVDGLTGIVFAPFLHGGMPHLIANTIPFLVLGWLTMMRRISDFFLVFFCSALASGLGIWLFGAPNSVHIGASGIVFGFLGFLLLRGWFERKFGALLLSLFVGVLYGGALWGMLPSQPGVSWQGHLFGFFGGVFAARLVGHAARSAKAGHLAESPNLPQ